LGQVSSERFVFDVPIEQVKTFRCRKRPIQMISWTVPLQKVAADGVRSQAGGPEVSVLSEKWLAGIDAANYAQSWKDAARFFQTAITEAGWSEALTKFRKPLGEMKTRHLLDAKNVGSLPGAPDGEYVVMQFETSFTAKEKAVETVTFMKEPDGSWKACGYFIK
jgi:hypothetical protein